MPNLDPPKNDYKIHRRRRRRHRRRGVVIVDK